MSVALTLLALIATVTAVSALGRRYDLPAPLLLVVIGLGASYLPFAHLVELSPELVLIGLLPPLLYAAAIRTSLVDINANRRAIGFLAVGLVIFTTFTVGLAAWLLLPIPFAAAVAFGAVVAPPDAVAATAIARRIGLPRGIVTVLEGESLLNDATALVALRTAIVAVAGTVSLGRITLNFIWAAAGGLAIGVGVALLIAVIRKHIKDPVTNTSISLMAPFAAYLAAEELAASGVIAVVVTGLILGHKAPIIQDSTSRLNERINWETIQFLLENSVFLLIGLQLRGILAHVATSNLSAPTIAIFCAGTLAAVVLSRPLWVFPVSYLLVKPTDEHGNLASWKRSAIVSWAGMRGVVTLAAAFVLMQKAIPEAPVLVLGAFVVTAGTLLLQGLSLPWLARRLDVRGPDEREDALQEATVLRSAAAAGRAELDRIVTPNDDQETVAMLQNRVDSRANAVWERLGAADAAETPSEQYRRLRLAMLAAERNELLKIRHEGTVDSEVLAGLMDTLDVEEAMIDRKSGRAEQVADRTLVTPARTTGECADLARAPEDIEPLTPEGCADCLRDGLKWVHLRLCLECGNVGCCDSSVGNHATKHFQHSRHPVMRSFEPGEAWRWCFVHELLG